MHNINKRKELLDAGKTLKVILSAVTNKRIVYVSKIQTIVEIHESPSKRTMVLSAVK